MRKEHKSPNKISRFLADEPWPGICPFHRFHPHAEARESRVPEHHSCIELALPV